MAKLKQSSVYTRMFLLVQSADHISGLIGASPTVNLSKAGGSFAAAGGTVTEVANGWYKIALTTTDTGTLGDLAYHVTATSGDPTDFVDQVVIDLLDDGPIAYTGEAMARGTVTTGGSTTSVPTSALTLAGSAATGVVSNQFAGRTVLFDGNTTTAGLRGASAAISASTASNTPTLTVGTLPATPVSGDTFSII